MKVFLATITTSIPYEGSYQDYVGVFAQRELAIKHLEEFGASGTLSHKITKYKWHFDEDNNTSVFSFNGKFDSIDFYVEETEIIGS